MKYIAPEDILVYSIDEVFMNVIPYLDTYQMTAHELAITLIREITLMNDRKETKIRLTGVVDITGTLF